ncbi:hypothetical protein ADUPG1_004606, partial [Aduncisulcus paluster]
TNLNAEPMKYYDGLNTVLYTGSNFQGGNPKTGLDVGWQQPSYYAGMTASDSDFAHSVPTPIPGAAWLFTFGLAGIALLRQRIITS